MQTVNLYNEDGIAVYLTADFDLCNPTDADVDIRVVGHPAYACSAEEAEQSIRSAYLSRIGVASGD